MKGAAARGLLVNGQWTAIKRLSRAADAIDEGARRDGPSPILNESARG